MEKKKKLRNTAIYSPETSEKKGNGGLKSQHPGLGSQECRVWGRWEKTGRVQSTSWEPTDDFGATTFFFFFF